MGGSLGICRVLQPTLFVLAVVVQTYLVLPHLWWNILPEEYGYIAILDLLPFQVKGLVTMIYFLIGSCFSCLNKLFGCRICRKVGTAREMALEVEGLLLERSKKLMEQKKNQ